MVTDSSYARSSRLYVYPAAGTGLELERQPGGGGVPMRTMHAAAGDRRPGERHRRPSDLDLLIRVGCVHPNGQSPTDPVATTWVDAARRGDHVGTRQVTERVSVHEVSARVDDPPVPVLSPLPPGPADPQLIHLIEGRVRVGQRAFLGQIVAELTDPERRRNLGRLLDTLLAATYKQAGIRSLLTTNPADFAVFGVFTCVTPAGRAATP